jgi:hypothetical protein
VPDIRNGKKNGIIFDESYKGNRWLSGDAGWDAAIKYMDELMADPRKPETDEAKTANTSQALPANID